MSANAVSANAVSAKALRVTAGTTAAEAVAAAGLPAAGPKAIVVVRDPSGTLRDLDWAPDVDTDVTPVALDERLHVRQTAEPCHLDQVLAVIERVRAAVD